jgi:protease-4
VVVLEGGIDFLSIAPVRDEVLTLADDEKCRALVLRVNSPGGSALASEILWEALDEFQETERPFVVSMAGVAASGGYYVASSADYIVAESSTITGSIGVVGMKIALGDAMVKVGITTHEHKRGEHADLFNSTRPFSPEERKIVRRSMLDVYATFKKRVREGRGDKLSDKLEKLAGGRVYSGRDALRVGLVDEMGGLGEAIAQARELAGVEKAKPILLPKPLSPLDALFRQPGEENDGDEFISMKGDDAGLSLKLETWWQQNAALGLVPADKAAQVHQHLEQLKGVQEDRIQLVAPPLPRF